MKLTASSALLSGSMRTSQSVFRGGNATAGSSWQKLSGSLAPLPGVPSTSQPPASLPKIHVRIVDIGLRAQFRPSECEARLQEASLERPAFCERSSSAPRYRGAQGVARALQWQSVIALCTCSVLTSLVTCSVAQVPNCSLAQLLTCPLFICSRAHMTLTCVLCFGPMT